MKRRQDCIAPIVTLSKIVPNCHFSVKLLQRVHPSSTSGVKLVLGEALRQELIATIAESHKSLLHGMPG